jgi:hypothetical protein
LLIRVPTAGVTAAYAETGPQRHWQPESSKFTWALARAGVAVTRLAGRLAGRASTESNICLAYAVENILQIKSCFHKF